MILDFTGEQLKTIKTALSIAAQKKRDMARAWNDLQMNKYAARCIQTAENVEKMAVQLSRALLGHVEKPETGEPEKPIPVAGPYEMQIDAIEDGEPAPCPFCDGLPGHICHNGAHTLFSVVCSCGAAGPYGATKNEAINNWSK